ncbi:MAG: DUF4249 domain-containing protein, partial [Cytophagaceae bacterium]
MKTLLHILILLMLAACGSLRNEVSPSLLSTEGEKLVVNSYISPQDTLLSVKVSRSKPVLGEQTDALPYNVANAIVSLTDGDRVVVLRYLSDKQWYEAKANLLPIVTGRTYTLTVSTPDGKQVTASATVPKPVPVNQGILDSTVVTTGIRLQKIYTVRLDWQDPANEANYYKYAAYFSWNPGIGYPINDQPKQASSTLRALPFARENRTGNLVTDDRQGGALLTSLAAEVGMVEVNANATNAQAALKKMTLGQLLPGPQVLLQLLSTEELYYRYTDAIIRQRENRSNPFAEPVLIPTNIQGGLG